MAFICDSHVHIYPGYSLHDLFHSAKSNLEVCLKEANQDEAKCAKLICLAERADCSFFTSLAERISQTDGLGCQQTEEENSLRVEVGQSEVSVIAGRQIATAERLELLAIGLTDVVEDGLPFRDVLKRVHELGAIPILPWSPGKWMFGRKTIVENILRSIQPSQLSIGDTALRPKLLPTPKLFGLASSLGYSILAGTDPLPLKNEEQRAGSYANFFSNEFDAAKPFKSLKGALTAKGTASLSGRRLGLGSVLLKLYELKVSG